MTCDICGREMPLRMRQLAHRIPQTRGKGGNLERYGTEVVHHKFNLASVCSEPCNSRASISNHPLEAARTLAEIYEALAREIRERIGEA